MVPSPPESNKLATKDIWELRWAIWGVLSPGLKPSRAKSPWLLEPGEYSLESHLFSHPPTREQFMQVISQHSEDRHRETFNTNQFPLVDAYHKAAHVDLFDAYGNRVGFIEVRRESLFANPVVCIPGIPDTDISAYVNQLPRVKRDRAHEIISMNEMWIREQMIQPGTRLTTLWLRKKLRALLKAGGLLKTV